MAMQSFVHDPLTTIGNNETRNSVVDDSMFLESLEELFPWYDVHGTLASIQFPGSNKGQRLSSNRHIPGFSLLSHVKQKAQAYEEHCSRNSSLMENSGSATPGRFGFLYQWCEYIHSLEWKRQQKYILLH